MEIVSGIHRIQAPLVDRFVCVYLLVGSEATLLIDTGLDNTTEEYILPYMQTNDLEPGRVRYIVTSHSDFDHSAGNRSAKDAFPGALLMCHRLDRAMIEYMHLILDRRYDEFKVDHGIFETEESREWMLGQSRTAPVDVELTGGERIRLGDEWVVEVLHTPGHSRGHLTIADPRSGALVICDATLYNAVLRADGGPAFPPTYRYVDSYVATCAQFEAMRPTHLLTSHYPVYSGDEVGAFLAESRRFVERTDQRLRSLLQVEGSGMTLREIIGAVNADLGAWPVSSAPALSQPIMGHLERMVAHGLVATGRKAGHVSFSWNGQSRM
jgi:glyoxylase-like metal-dependent hydrolase (beta-lactamase superfamily II)